MADAPVKAESGGNFSGACRFTKIPMNDRTGQGSRRRRPAAALLASDSLG